MRATYLLPLSTPRTFYCVDRFKTPLCVLRRTWRTESFGRRAVECLFVGLFIVCLLGLYCVNEQDACGANCLEEDYENPLSVAGA